MATQNQYNPAVGANDVDITEDVFCVGGVTLVRRSSVQAGVTTITWHDQSGAAVTPTAPNIAAAVPGRCIPSGSADIIADCDDTGTVAIGTFPARTEVLTPAPYTDTVRAVVDQIVLVSGCNDDRRDALLNVIAYALGGTATATRSTATAAGTVAAGAQAVSFLNVGTAAGTVLGEPIGPGETVDFSGYYDDQVNTFYRLPALAYDATGTTIRISTVV